MLFNYEKTNRNWLCFKCHLDYRVWTDHLLEMVSGCFHDLKRTRRFLAGLTAPLALLWLVIGYFQQSRELALNTEALKLQQEELRRQVEETAALAKNAGRQAKAAEEPASLNSVIIENEEKERRERYQPNFVADGGGRSGESQYMDILNTGVEVNEVSILLNGSAQSQPQPRWPNGMRQQIRYSTSDTFPLNVSIQFEDKLGDRYKLDFEITANNQFRRKRAA